MLTLITGGSGSGKSEYAEQLLLSLSKGKRYYIATMIAYDMESKERIKRHREMRKDKAFETIECYRDVKRAEVPGGADVLLECMSNLVANEYFSEESGKEGTADRIIDGIKALYERTGQLVIVTNEVFSDGLTYSEETINYLKELGTINRRIAAMADLVVEVVYGIPVIQKRGGNAREAV